jgi:hypothetical protein
LYDISPDQGERVNLDVIIIQIPQSIDSSHCLKRIVVDRVPFLEESLVLNLQRGQKVANHGHKSMILQVSRAGINIGCYYVLCIIYLLSNAPESIAPRCAPPVLARGTKYGLIVSSSRIDILSQNANQSLTTIQ